MIMMMILQLQRCWLLPTAATTGSSSTTPPEEKREKPFVIKAIRDTIASKYLFY
jgi:hypothetical protein